MAGRRWFGFVMALVAALVMSCGAAGSSQTTRDESDNKGHTRTWEADSRRTATGTTTGGATGGGGATVEEEPTDTAVVFVDKTPPPAPAADGGDDESQVYAVEARPEPRPERKQEVKEKFYNFDDTDLSKGGLDQPKAKKKHRQRDRAPASKDGQTTTVADEDGGGGTGEGAVETETPGGDTDSMFLLAHNMVEAEDWGSEFAPIAHEIGPVYTHTGGLPTFSLTRVGDLSVTDWQREHPGAELDLPLKHTHVDAELTGPIGRVHVQQTFQNPHDEVIEAVYTFPLPENSAVDGMKMVIGERVIEGVIMERGKARQVYEQARAAGHTAALLEQERPNVFTQSVANIAPKTDIDIETRYVQDLTYDEGRYEFVFPMVVGPRYVPPGGGDSARINPPVLGRGDRSGHDISVTVRADAGVPIKNFAVPTHETDGNLDASGRLTVRLTDKDRLPNRDFVMRYEVGGDEPAPTILSEMVDGQGYFTLMVQPPAADVDALIGTREMLFVVDVSGSMAGVPLAMSKELVEIALGKLRPVDTFNIMTFASGTTQLFSSPRPANRQNLESGLAFVDRMESGGGTDMLTGVSAALDAPIDAGMQRVIVFMTDGYIGNEDQVLSTVEAGVASVEKQQATARIFAFGVGSSTNRYLVDGLATSGQGTAEYALNREDPQIAADSFFNVVDHPIWTDVEIDFGQLAVDDAALYPSRVPDLFASHPLVMHGTYSKGGSGTVTLRARSRGQQIEIPLEVTLEKKTSAHDGALGTLWARSAIGSLQRDMLYSSEQAKLEGEITALGLAHAIVTPFTSFVAVDESTTVTGGGAAIRKVDQPVETPEGMQR